MNFAAKLLLFFEIRKHKSPKYLPFLQKRAKKRQLFGNGDAEHRTPRADVGRADVGIKFRRNGRRKERHGMPHNERCREPDSIGDKRRKKNQPAR